MCRKLFFLVSFVLVLGLVSNASGTDYTWDNFWPLVGNRLWTDANNWDPNGVPGLVDGDRVDLDFDPNIGTPNGPLITAGMIISLATYDPPSYSQDALYVSGDDDFTTRDEPNLAEPNAAVVTMTGGSLTLNGYFGLAARGVGIFNMSGGTVTIHGGGKFKIGKYAADTKKGHCGSHGTLNINSDDAVFDYSEGDATVPKMYGKARINMNAGVIMFDELDMEEVGEYAENSGIVDFNGGTMILNEDRLSIISEYASDGYLYAFGVPHGEIDSNSGLRAVVVADYDVTNTGKTTIVGDEVDPDMAHSPNPGDGATAGLDPNSKVKLSWGAMGANVLFHAVYYGDNDSNVTNGAPGTFQGNRVAASWYTPVLGLGATRYWRIDEHEANTWVTAFEDDFCGATWDANWTNVGNWTQDATESNSPDSNSAKISAVGNVALGTLTSDSIDASTAKAIEIEFAYRTDDIEAPPDDEFCLYYTSDGTNYDFIADLDIGDDDVWLNYSDTIIEDSQYFTANFGIRFYVDLDKNGENVWVDDVVVKILTVTDEYTGDVWEFTSGDYLTIDDFESYVDDTSLRSVWTTGNAEAYYILDGANKTMNIKNLYPGPREKGRTPTDGDWTKEEVKSLSISFKGDPNNSDMDLYVKVTDGTTTEEVNYPLSMFDMKLGIEGKWKEFNVDLEEFNTAGVDLNSVTHITIGLRGGSGTGDIVASGSTYPPWFLLDDVRLYQRRCISEHKPTADIERTADKQGGDKVGCVVDNYDLNKMALEWLISDYNIPYAGTPAAPDANLIAHYTFEDDPGDGWTDDSAGSPADGNLIGDATRVSDAERGNVLLLDGNADYVDLGFNVAKFNLTAEITIAAWIKVNTFSRGQQVIIAKGSDTWRIERTGHTSKVRFGHNGLTGGDGTGGKKERPNVKDGEWHHVAGVYDGSKTYLYIDGALDNSLVNTGSIDTDANNVYIGENIDAAGRWFDGLIDEVRIYDYGLEPNQVARLADDMAKPDDAANDGYKYVPVRSKADLNADTPAEEPRGQRSVNFRDFAELAADNWLEQQLWP